MNVLTLTVSDSENLSLDIYSQLLEKCDDCKTILDVGCGHGKYSILASGRFSVTGIDARPDRIPFEYNNIEWKVQQVKDVVVSHDIVLFSGILYHLPLSSQIDLVAKCRRAKYIIVNTHIAIERHTVYLNKLSGFIKAGKFVGRNYHEGKNLKNRPMAAFDNEYSFWHTEDSLISLFDEWECTRIVPPVAEDRNFYFMRKPCK